MNDITKDRFFLKEFIAPILPAGMVLAAIYLAGLWIVDRLTGTRGGDTLAIAQLGGAVALVLLAGACRALAKRGALHQTALVSLAYGGLFASSLAVRAEVAGEGLLTVVPICMMVALLASIFALRMAHLAACFIVVMAPALVLTSRIDPAVSNEARFVPHAVVFTALTIVPLYLLVNIIKERYYAALTMEQERAKQDSLTSLMNRAAWCARADGMLERPREASTSVALLYLDVDHFKQVNDGSGHAVGDEVLLRMGSLLRLGFPEGSLISRYGGDEFVILMTERSPGEAMRRANRLRDALASVATSDPAVTVSIGVAFHAPGEPRDAVLRRADLALLRAKSLGRNRIELATPAQSPSRPAETAPHRDRQIAPARESFRTHLARPT